MSEAYIVIAVIMTFAAVMLGGIAVEITVAERRRTVEVLQTQVGHLAPNLRAEDLQRSFLERVFFPVLRALGSTVRRITPIDMRLKIEKKLVLAGSPPAWDAEKVAAFKLIGSVVGAGISGTLALTSGSAKGSALMMIALFGGIGYFAPDAVLSGRA